MVTYVVKIMYPKDRNHLRGRHTIVELTDNIANYMFTAVRRILFMAQLRLFDVLILIQFMSTFFF